MRQADERPDPWSPFSMRPMFSIVLGTFAVAICGFLVFAYFTSRPHRLEVAIDKRTGERAAFGIYVRNENDSRLDEKTGMRIHGSQLNPTWPNSLVVAAWDDGRVVWSVGARPEDGEVVCAMTSPQAVASARERLVAAMDDVSRPSVPPYVQYHAPEIVSFARDGGRYQLIRGQTWQVEPEAEDEVRLAPFREKWAACRAIAMEIIPTTNSKQAADWLGFQRDNN